MFARLSKFFREASAELSRVTWPTRRQAIRSSAIVLGFTLVFAAIVALVDFGLATGIKEILFRFG